MLKQFIFYVVLQLAALQAFPAIEMKCASIGAGGDVTITWNNTSGAGTFSAYYIYHSTSASGFSLIDSVLVYATQNYTDVNANALSANAYYYVVLKNTSGITTLSDTIHAIRLSVINTGNGYANLSWNYTRSPLIATNSSSYKIFREYPAGVWTLIDSVDARTKSPLYADEITVCSDTVKYRIEVSDSSGCVSVSGVFGDLFSDIVPPADPFLDSVSVDASGNAVLGWTANTSKDTYAYIILQNIGGAWIAIDTIYGINNTFYATGLNATINPLEFSLNALDSCNNPAHYQTPGQKSMVLNGFIDRCTASMNLTWNPYVNSKSTPTYVIAVSENGGASTIAGTTSATSFSATGLKSDSTYCFTVIAVLNGGTATASSTVVCAKADLPVPAQFTYLKYVTVNSPSLVEVSAYVDTAAGVKEYHLLRSTSGGFSHVATVPNNKTPIITFFDFQLSDADKTIYYYEVAPIDTCGNTMLLSQISHTIVPFAIANSNYTNTVLWNNYDLWPGGVSDYDIFMSVDSMPATLVGSVPFGDSSFLDVSPPNYTYTSGNFCYRIAAYEAAGNPYGFRDTSYSAEACAKQRSSVFVPNAFRPGGYNNVFNPASAFVGIKDYSLKIYSRFGDLVFESNNPSIGWDGSYKGFVCPVDVYAWMLDAKANDGTDIKKSGRVTLIR